MNKQFYVYLLGSKSLTLYVGVTSNLIQRVYEHKHKLVDGFTYRYNVSMLLHYELFDDVEKAIEREKQLKNWHREWKLNLIKMNNPELRDLYNEILK